MREGPAIGLIETDSIARGMVVCDAMVKRAAVDVLDAYTTTPGKYVILVAGEVAEVEEAMDAGLDVAAESLLDHVFLPYPHPRLVPAIKGEPTDTPVDGFAVVEIAAIASCIQAADAALKAAEVDLLEIRLATGIGGKAFFTLTGELYELQAAVEAAQARVQPDRMVDTEIIARPHQDFTDAAVKRGRVEPVWHPARHP